MDQTGGAGGRIGFVVMGMHSLVPCHAVLWQAHLVNDLLRAYAPFAYGMEKECWLLHGIAWDF